MSSPLRYCKGCEKDLKLSEFYLNKQGKAVHSYCKHHMRLKAIEYNKTQLTNKTKRSNFMKTRVTALFKQWVKTGGPFETKLKP